MNIPLLDLARERRALEPELSAAVSRVLDGMALYRGPEAERLESEFAALVRTGYAVGVGSGTDALLLSLRALGVGPGDKVVVPALTFIATAAAVHYAGARPVFCDVDPDTGALDVSSLASCITARTAAVIPVHLYGNPAPMDAVLDLARRHGLAVVEDACQAVGAVYRDRPVGCWGHAAAFSFVFTKNLHGYGDGGVVTTDDPALARRVRRLGDHGRAGKNEHVEFGLCSRLDALQAAILRVKLPFLEEWSRRRRHLADRYAAALGGRVTVLRTTEGSRPVYHQFVLRVSDRDDLARHLQGRGVGTGIHYPVPCHLQPAAAGCPTAPGGLAGAETLAAEALSLPVHPFLRPDEQEYVIAQVLDWLGRRGESRCGR